MDHTNRNRLGRTVLEKVARLEFLGDMKTGLSLPQTSAQKRSFKGQKELNRLAKKLKKDPNHPEHAAAEEAHQRYSSILNKVLADNNLTLVSSTTRGLNPWKKDILVSQLGAGMGPGKHLYHTSTSRKIRKMRRTGDSKDLL